MSSSGHNEVKFRSAILAKSVSSDWDEAKAEWVLHFVYNDGSDRSCECEHSPIHQICIIKNRKNSNELEVGNVCVRRFLRLMSQRVFSVIKRLQSDIEKSLNLKSLELFRERGVISYAEEQDYREYWRRRKRLTDAQRLQKADINQRVLAYVSTETPRLIAAARARGIKA